VTDPGESLLFVDDEKNILNSLRRLFRTQGYTIHVAESGAAGLEVLREHPVDLIISDMRMPGMDGAQFLEAAAKERPRAVRILLTGGTDLGATIAAINHGRIHRYIAKPWEDTEITLTVRQALQTKRLQEDKERLTALLQSKNEELLELNSSLEEKVRRRTEEIEAAAKKLDLAYQALTESYEHTIQVISSLIGRRESLSGRTARGVADLARKIALAINRSPKEVQDVYFASLLHELGKLSLPDKLLERPVDRLSDVNRGKYFEYPVYGQNALMAIEELQDAALLIRAQEEHFDGAGYPDGLTGEEIPVGARILAISRDYFASQLGKLSSRTLDEKEAFDYLSGRAGKQYDPRLVDVLERLLAPAEEGGLDVSERVCALHDLEPGMVLSRDVFNRDELLLLSKGRTLTDAHIQHFEQLAALEERSYQFYVCRGD